MAKAKKKMFESKFDEKRLREMISKGMNAEQIKNELGIASMQSLRQHVLRLCSIDKIYHDIPGLYARGKQRMPMVNFKGDIRLTQAMYSSFEGSTYAHNDRFEIDADNERIILTRMGGNSEAADETEAAPETE